MKKYLNKLIEYMSVCLEIGGSGEKRKEKYDFIVLNTGYYHG